MYSFILRTTAFTHHATHQVLFQLLNFAAVIASGLMIWKGLGLLTNSESPIVVVLRCAHPPFLLFPFVTAHLFTRSGSMEPAFYRGDLLFLTNPQHEKYHTGDITVYKIPGNEIPIVHRVLETHDVTPKKKRSKRSSETNDLEKGYVLRSPWCRVP